MIPAELPPFGSSSKGGVPRSTVGFCGRCGAAQIVLYERWDGLRMGSCCLLEAIAEAEARHLMAGMHRIIGCVADPCPVCVR